MLPLRYSRHGEGTSDDGVLEFYEMKQVTNSNIHFLGQALELSSHSNKRYHVSFFTLVSSCNVFAITCAYIMKHFTLLTMFYMNINIIIFVELVDAMYKPLMYVISTSNMISKHQKRKPRQTQNTLNFVTKCYPY